MDAASPGQGGRDFWASGPITATARQDVVGLCTAGNGAPSPTRTTQLGSFPNGAKHRRKAQPGRRGGAAHQGPMADAPGRLGRSAADSGCGPGGEALEEQQRIVGRSYLAGAARQKGRRPHPSTETADRGEATARRSGGTAASGRSAFAGRRERQSGRGGDQSPGWRQRCLQERSGSGSIVERFGGHSVGPEKRKGSPRALAARGPTAEPSQRFEPAHAAV